LAKRLSGLVDRRLVGRDWAGVVQGFATPPLLLLIMAMTNNRTIMGDKINGPTVNILGWATTATIFAASAGLVTTWFV
jgi:Mn2+/Fe2+ NRAMP family transporter